MHEIEKSTTMGTEKGYRSYQKLILNTEQLLSSTPAQPEASVSVLFYQVQNILISVHSTTVY